MSSRTLEKDEVTLCVDLLRQAATATKSLCGTCSTQSSQLATLINQLRDIIDPNFGDSGVNAQSLKDFDRLLDEVIANNPDALPSPNASASTSASNGNGNGNENHSGTISGGYDTTAISLRDIPKMKAFENTILSDYNNGWIRKQQISLWNKWNLKDAIFKNDNPWYLFAKNESDLLLLPFKLGNDDSVSSTSSAQQSNTNQNESNNDDNGKLSELKMDDDNGDAMIERSKSSMLNLNLERDSSHVSVSDNVLNERKDNGKNENSRNGIVAGNNGDRKDLELISNAKIAQIHYEYILNGLNKIFSKWNDHTTKVSQKIQSKIEFEKYFYKYTNEMEKHKTPQYSRYNQTSKYISLFDSNEKDLSQKDQTELKFVYDILHACIIEIKYLFYYKGDSNSNSNENNSNRNNIETILGNRMNKNTLRMHIASKLALLFCLPKHLVMKLSYMQEFMTNSVYKSLINVGVTDVNNENKLSQAYLKCVDKCQDTTFVELIYRLGLWSLFSDSRNKSIKNEKEAITYFIIANEKLPSLALQCDKNGDTLLHYAATRGQLQFSKLLIKHGALLTRRNASGNSAYQYAADNVATYLQLCVLGGANAGEKLLKHSNEIRRENETINIFIKYLGLSHDGMSGIQLAKSSQSSKKNNEKQSKHETAAAALSLIANAVIGLLNDRQPVDNTLMLLAWKFLEYKHFVLDNMLKGVSSAKTIKKEETNNNESKKLEIEYPNVKRKDLFNALTKATSEALDYDSLLKSRDYLWFKEYLFDSNIWYQDSKMTNTQWRSKQSMFSKKIKSKADAYKDSLLFNDLSQLVDDKLIKQKLFLKNSINDIISGKNGKQEAKYWESIVNYEEYLICENNNDENEAGIRQDYIADPETKENLMSNGVQTIYSERQLDLISVEFDAFDAHNEYDNYGYLTQLLINAHILNDPFQKSIQKVFDIELLLTRKGDSVQATQGRSKTQKYHVLYQQAPVKLASRCHVKAETDYATKAFPKCACLVDIIRCSLTFDTCEDFIKGLKLFEDSVNNGSSGSIVKIVRRKNMFKRFAKIDESKQDENDNNNNKYQYCDIKYNVIISKNNISVVGEVQFLLRFMLNAKTMGHSLYGVKRRDDYVSNINRLSVMQSDRRAQILAAMTNQDLKALGNELLFNCEFVLDIIDDVDGNPIFLYPLFYAWYKGFKLMLSSLMHLNELNNKGREILHKNMFHGFGHPLFGLSWKTLLDHPNTQTKMLIEILKCPLLDVNIGNGYLLWHACHKGIYFICQTLLKYRINELNFNLYNCGVTPIMALCVTLSQTFVKERLTNCVKIAKLLIENGNEKLDLNLKSIEFESSKQTMVVSYDNKPSFPSSKEMVKAGMTALDIAKSAKKPNAFTKQIVQLLQEKMVVPKDIENP